MSGTAQVPYVTCSYKMSHNEQKLKFELLVSCNWADNLLHNGAGFMWIRQQMAEIWVNEVPVILNNSKN